MKKESVLIVDDDESFLGETEEILSASGYDVVTATTGREAKRLAEIKHPAIALLDKKLPDMDGQDLVKFFNKSSMDISCIIVTAHASLNSSIAGFKDGVYDYIIKPAKPDEILNKVKEAIGKKKEEDDNISSIKLWGMLQQKKYETLFEQASDAIVIVEAANGVIAECNGAATRLTGYARGDLLNAGFETICRERLAERCAALSPAGALESSGCISETGVITRDGGMVPCIFSCALAQVDGKKYYQVIFHDLSELKKRQGERDEAQKNMKAAREFAEMLLDVTPSAVFSIDTRKRITAWNRRAEEVTGYSKSEIVGRECTLFAEHPCKERCGLFSNAVEKPIHNKESTIRRKDGEMRIISKNVDILRNAEGVVIGGIESFEDITEMRRLDEENEKLLRVARDIGECVVITDGKDNITFSNEAVGRVFGYAPGDLRGKQMGILFSDLNSPRLLAEISSMLQIGKRWDGEAICLRKDGSPFPASTSKDPLKLDKFDYAGSIVIVADITEKRLMEDELRRHAKDLEDKVSERTAELKGALDDVQKANEKLKQFDKRKSEFVANVAHEIGNPLFIIKEGISIAEEMLGEKLSAKPREMIDISLKEIDRLINFSKSMLDISRIESGKIEVKKARLKVVPVIENVLQQFRPFFDRKKVKTVADLDGAPDEILADEGLLKQLLINLVSNALKYTPSGKCVRLKAVREENFLRFEIRDEGPGIPEDEREKIFDKYHRIFSEQKEGTGLGLAIAKEIVEFHEGRIWVESEAGMGSTFVVLLPVGGTP